MLSSAVVLPLPCTYPLPARMHHVKPQRVGKFERIPKWLNCVPLVIQWLWLSLRYGSVSLPSAANPHITCGGMVGEGKQEYFNGMGETANHYVAPFVLVMAEGDDVLASALLQLKARSIGFPIVAKPDLGWCGYGVKRLDNDVELAAYLSAFPKNQTVLLQTYLPEAGEAGIFYIRHPETPAGNLIGILLRYYPKVIGDGVHTIAQLIAADIRLRRIVNNKLHQPGYSPDAIPMAGEEVRLALIGSTRVGGLYCDGEEIISPELSVSAKSYPRPHKLSNNSLRRLSGANYALSALAGAAQYTRLLASPLTLVQHSPASAVLGSGSYV
jgi:hypothetical protein